MQTGRKILNLRCDRKISQQDLARACSITPSALSKIEAGINSPRANIIWRIAKKLGVTVEYLLDENMPYPYQGYSYRQELFEKDIDPASTVRLDVTREEKGFLEALRKSNQMAREIAYAMPEAKVETLRLIHFLLHRSKINNPDETFLRHFESLVTTGSPDSAPESSQREAAASQSNGKVKAARAAQRPARGKPGRPGRPRKYPARQ
jgi:transcriptional regulator with XRE-family HTH domain